MSKLMVPVVRDLVAEYAGIESSVGQSVEVIKKITRYSRITVGAVGAGKLLQFPVRRDVYLVNAKQTRFMVGKRRAEKAIVLFEGYEGNDVYSAEELGL